MKRVLVLVTASVLCTGAYADFECANALPTIPRDRLSFREKNKLGYLDRDFKVAVPARYSYAGEYIDGRAWVGDSSKEAPKLIDKTGAVVFNAFIASNQWTYANVLIGPRVLGPSSDLVLLEVHGTEPENPGRTRYGFKDLKGAWRIDPDFDEAEPFSEGLAAVQIADPRDLMSSRAGYIRPDGTFAIAPTFKKASSFSEGLATVQTLEGSRGVIDKSGKLLFATAYESIGPFSEGLAAAKKGAANYVLVRQNGTLLPAPTLSFAKPFKQGLAAVQIGGRDKLSRFEPYNLEGGGWGYLNKKGEIAIAANFSWACDFSEGLAAVNIGAMNDEAHTASGGKWGYVDESGALKIREQFSRADPFVDGIANVEIDGRDAYIDRTGRVLWRESKP